MKKPSNSVETKIENRLFQINEKPENFGQQKWEKIRKKPILDLMADY